MKTITVVDDDPGLRDAFRVIFDQNNFTVNIYPDGEPILANECPVPDVYILDKQLNGVDGLDVCKFIKLHRKTMHVPVIMLSANPTISSLAPIAGADAWLEKPFEIKVLRTIVNKLLNGATVPGAVL
jgi:DNA-binding response OmpR family regulator